MRVYYILSLWSLKINKCFILFSLNITTDGRPVTYDMLHVISTCFLNDNSTFHNIFICFHPNHQMINSNIHGSTKKLRICNSVELVGLEKYEICVNCFPEPQTSVRKPLFLYYTFWSIKITNKCVKTITPHCNQTEYQT